MGAGELTAFYLDWQLQGAKKEARWSQDREGKTGRVGLAETNYSTQNGYTTRSYCVAPRHRELYPTSYDKPY